MRPKKITEARLLGIVVALATLPDERLRYVALHWRDDVLAPGVQEALTPEKRQQSKLAWSLIQKEVKRRGLRLGRKS